MIGELGFLSDVKTFQEVQCADNCTLVFDSTTQDGKHINCVVLTTPTSSHLVSLERLPGGKATDYKQHICDCISNLALVGSKSTGLSVDASLKCILSKIKCCLTDRAPVNHATVKLLEQEWNIKIVEFYCNLHPLESITTKVREVLRNCETASNVSECLAWRIIVGMNSLRFSDQLGLINDVKDFLKKNVPLSLITRFRGNRLHMLFHLGAAYFPIFEYCKQFVLGLSSTNNTVKKLQQLFTEEAAIEMQVLGIIGKMLTGPWMSTFYTSLQTQKDPVDTMNIVRGVIENVKVLSEDTLSIFSCKKDFFGNPLPKNVIESLMISPTCAPIFQQMMTVCLKGIVEVLSRQYEQSFATTAASSSSLLSSVRQHTMLAESIIGEFSERKKLAPNAYISSISDVIKAKRNQVRKFIYDLDADKLQKYITMAMLYSRRNTVLKKSLSEGIEKEIVKRISQKNEKKEKRTRCFIQRKLQNIKNVSLASLLEEYSPDCAQVLYDILTGNVVGRTIRHIWNVDGANKEFTGIIIKFMNPKYTISYFDDNVKHCQLNKYAFGADYIMQDLHFATLAANSE